MIIRKNPILQTIAYVMMLFWGLSFSPSYATETIRYYAFVMYKAPSAGSTWELPPKDMETLEPGSYRFQIVRLRQEVNQIDWIALRGEFEFIPEVPPKKGVKLSKKETLDSRDEVNVTGSKANSLWLKTSTEYSWKEAGRPWVQPLIDAMNKSITGAPDPNLMRFLVLKKKAKWSEKKYTLYRLHYFPDNSLSENEALNALSRFVDPNEASKNDIETLRQWIKGQESFKKAGYLGKADERHKDFYDGFSNASNDFLDNLVNTQAQKNLKNADAKIKEANGYIQNANEQIAKAENGDNKEKLIEFANNNLNLAEVALNTAQTEIDKAKEKIGEDGVADVQKKIDDVKANIETARQKVNELEEGIDLLTVIFFIIVIPAAIFLLVMLFKNLKDGRDRGGDDYLYNPNHSRHQEKHHGSNKSSSSQQNWDTQNQPDSDEYSQSNVDGQKDVAPQNDDFVGTTLEHPIPMGTSDTRAVPSPQPSADYVLKKDIDGIVENQALAVLFNHFGELLQGNIQQLQNNQDFKNLVVQIVKEQVVDSLNKEISEFVVEKVKSTLAKHSAQERTTIDEQTTLPLPSSAHQPIQTTTQNMGRQPYQTPSTKQPNKVVEIKNVLISMNAVDKAEIELLETTTDTCTFVTQVVSQCLELNQPITFYRRLNESIQDFTDGKVSLILPNEGEDTNQEEHKVVSQKTVTKGRTNVIASVIRPGVRCDGTVRRKAEVVQKT